MANSMKMASVQVSCHIFFVPLKIQLNLIAGFKRIIENLSTIKTKMILGLSIVIGDTIYQVVVKYNSQSKCLIFCGVGRNITNAGHR